MYFLIKEAANFFATVNYSITALANGIALYLSYSFLIFKLL